MLDTVDKIEFYLFIASTLIAIGAAIHSFITGRAMANRRMIDAVNTRVDQLKSKHDVMCADITRIQNKVDELNISSEIGEIHSRINDVAKSSSEQSGQLKQINHTLGIIQQHLIGK